MRVRLWGFSGLGFRVQVGFRLGGLELVDFMCF